jgi:hypothetical protein
VLRTFKILSTSYFEILSKLLIIINLLSHRTPGSYSSYPTAPLYPLTISFHYSVPHTCPRLWWPLFWSPVLWEQLFSFHISVRKCGICLSMPDLISLKIMSFSSLHVAANDRTFLFLCNIQLHTYMQMIFFIHSSIDRYPGWLLQIVLQLISIWV